jgi:myosin heavy subunit
MSYGFNSVDDISRAICHSAGMKDKHGTPMCDVNAKIIYEHIKSLEKKMLPKGWHMVEAEGSLKVSRDLMKVSEEKINLEKENKKLKEERDFFHSEFHKTLEHQSKDSEQYQKQYSSLSNSYKNLGNTVKEYEKRNNELQVKNYDLEVALEEKQGFRGKNRLQIALDEIKRLETQIGVLKRMNKRLRKNKP